MRKKEIIQQEIASLKSSGKSLRKVIKESSDPLVIRSRRLMSISSIIVTAIIIFGYPELIKNFNFSNKFIEFGLMIVIIFITVYVLVPLFYIILANIFIKNNK